MNQLLYDNFDVQNPLDYLDEQLKRKPRSSMEDYEQSAEIPNCDPPFISMGFRRDSGRSNRSRRQLETYSPQHSPVRAHAMKVGAFMVADTFDADVDFLWPQRQRLPSETCMSSNLRTLSDDALTSQQPKLCCPESSFPIFENDTLCDEMQRSIDDAPLLKDTCSLFEAQGDRMDECINDNLNIITHLKPIAVHKSDEESMEDGLDDASFLSMKPCPSLEDEDSCSSKHKPKPNSPATMIKHRVKRKKKTPEQIDYLRELFFQLGGEWDGKVRKEAMRKTGLSRIQVYKWFFDMKLQQKPKEKRVEAAIRVSYPPTVVQQTLNSSELTSVDFIPKAIFKIERVNRI